MRRRRWRYVLDVFVDDGLGPRDEFVQSRPAAAEWDLLQCCRAGGRPNQDLTSGLIRPNFDPIIFVINYLMRGHDKYIGFTDRANVARGDRRGSWVEARPSCGPDRAANSRRFGFPVL